jgi:hypothetical protein
MSRRILLTKARARSSKSSNSTANLGFEAKLWLAADTFPFSLSPFDFLSRLAPHGMAGFVLVNGSICPKTISNARN